MTESKQIQQILLSEDSEECDTLLDKGELLHKESIYDLKKIPGVSTTGSNEPAPLPVELSDGLEQIAGSPRPTPEDNDDGKFASPRGQEGYLPATLRAAISVANKHQTEEDQDRINALCASPPLAKRASPHLVKRKKKTRTIRRTKSDKTRVLTATDLDLEEDNLAKSLHIKPIESSSEQELERSCKSEELRKIVNRKSDPKRRKSESLHERRPTRSRREKGRSRRSNPNKETAPKEPSKSPSARRSKPPRSPSKYTASKSLDKTEVDEQVVDWKRTSSKQSEQSPKPSEQQLSCPRRKPKKSRSTGSNAAAKSRRSRRSRSRQTRSLSTSRKSRSGKAAKSLTLSVGATKGSKGAVDRKGPSPRQLQRKRSQKQKQKQAEAEKHKPRPLKSTESTDDTQKPRSRRTLMLTSKATTPSCRNLLRKISQMNDDRISKENGPKNGLNKPEPISEIPELPKSEPNDEKPEPIDELSRSTLSTSHSTTQSLAELEETIHSAYSSTKPRDESPKIHSTTQTELEGTDHRACSTIRTKEERPKIPEPDNRDEKKEKPPRTKSAPLRDMLKGKAKLSKSSSNNSLTLLSLKSDKPNTPPKRSMKKFGHKSFAAFGNRSFTEQFQKFGHKSLSDQLQKFGKILDVKGSSKSRKCDDDTTRTGNRSKGKQDEPLERSRSDSSLGLPKKKSNKKKSSSTSQYDLMLSMHSTEEDYEDYECDSDSNDDNSFSGDDVGDFNENLKVPEASKSVAPSPTIDLDDEEEESRDKVVNLKDTKPIEKIKKKEGNKKLSEHVAANKAEDCDDILSMAEFSANSQLTSGPQKPQSCLQIDFSQFSEHGTPVVKTKKLAKRLNKSSRDGRTSVRTPTVKV